MSSSAPDPGPSVRHERDGALATVVLDRPERRNPLSLAVMRELTATLAGLGEDPGVRAIVLGATGPVFCAGHDLREIAAGDGAEHERIFGACAELMLTIHGLGVPVIARVQGLATAAGCQLVAACDLAVAAEEARFATPGVRIGLFCTTPAVEITRAVGRTRAMEMLLTGDPIDAPTALAWGLVNRVVPANRLDQAAREFGERVSRASRATVAIGRRAVGAHIDLPLDEAYGRAAAVMSDNASHPDAREGIDAFLGKREPIWSSSDRE